MDRKNTIDITHWGEECGFKLNLGIKDTLYHSFEDKKRKQEIQKILYNFYIDIKMEKVGEVLETKIKEEKVVLVMSEENGKKVLTLCYERDM